jgi:thiosulfate sulfurtransferase
MFWKRVKQITVADAKSLIEGKDALMVDVRKPEDYAVAHVEGAVLADKKKVHEVIENSNKDRPVICYCYVGISSRVACKNLTKSGFTQVLNLKGGYGAWKKHRAAG